VIDAYASQSHYLDHLLPIWHRLLPSERGTLYVPQALTPLLTIPHKTVRLPPAARHPVMIAGAPDLPKVGKRPVVFVEHGTGQTYQIPHSSYAGGPDRGTVRLFLCPNERVAAANLEAYPNVPAPVVGSPRVEQLARMLQERRERPVVAWHWNCDLVPETRTAFPQYRKMLPELAGWIGHGHPRIWGTVETAYKHAKLEPVQWWMDVIKAGPSVVVADNTSVQWEAVALGIPVVFVNASWYRRDVEHGLRFWEYSNCGPHVNHPGELAEVAKTVHDWADVYDVRRREVAGLLYGQSSGSAWRAAETIRAAGMT
jgi:hypothetical protein